MYIYIYVYIHICIYIHIYIYIALKFQHMFVSKKKQNIFSPMFSFHNRLETQVLDTYCGHLNVQKISKRHPKTFFLFNCYVLDFVVGTWAIDTCAFDFVRLEISKTMNRKNRVKESVFTRFVIFCQQILQIQISIDKTP